MPSHNPSGQPPFIPVNLPVVPNILIGKAGAGLPSGYAGVQFVSGDFGSDAFDGLTVNTPLKNLDTAYNRCIGGANEIVCVLGGTASVNFSSKIASGGAGLVWSKNFTHCVGLTNPLALGQRARITNGASTVLLTPLIQVSGIGCLFQNIEIANVGSHATQAAVALALTGVRNSFIDCQISGGFTATTTANAAMRSLLIGGTVGGTAVGPADENFFKHCYIGLDTIARTTTNVEVEILGGSARVRFEDCTFSIYATGSGSGAVIVKVGTNGIDRHLLFERCKFINPSTLSGGVALSDAMSISATPGGVVLLTGGCLIVGATALSASDAAIFSDNAYAAATTGKAVNLSW